LLAEFEALEDLVSAAERAYADGYRHMDAYTLFPVHGLAEVIGFHTNRVSLLVLIAGVIGAGLGFFSQYWAAVIDYPINVGGRPLNSWPAFIPITFEVTIWCRDRVLECGVERFPALSPANAPRLPGDARPFFCVSKPPTPLRPGPRGRFSKAWGQRVMTLSRSVHWRVAVAAGRRPVRSLPARACSLLCLLLAVGCRRQMADGRRSRWTQRVFEDRRVARPRPDRGAATKADAVLPKSRDGLRTMQLPLTKDLARVGPLNLCSAVPWAWAPARRSVKRTCAATVTTSSAAGPDRPLLRRHHEAGIMPSTPDSSPSIAGPSRYIRPQVSQGPSGRIDRLSEQTRRSRERNATTGATVRKNAHAGG
jgi:hypothetical protein